MFRVSNAEQRVPYFRMRAHVRMPNRAPGGLGWLLFRCGFRAARRALNKRAPIVKAQLNSHGAGHLYGVECPRPSRGCVRSTRRYYWHPRAGDQPDRLVV